ncbi:MAG: hypothetical protein KBS95_03095 [Alistipes sp.]|nr:hypothetical protein [Candidatus Alistipes equi]
MVRNRSIPFTIEAPSKEDIMAKGRDAFYRMLQAAAKPVCKICHSMKLTRESDSLERVSNECLCYN